MKVIYTNNLLVGIPDIFWFGTEGDFNVMVMELLGPNLEELHSCAKHKFSLKTVLMIANQTVIHVLSLDKIA